MGQSLLVEQATHSIYDYTDDQSEMLRLYELRTTALVGRDFHAQRASRFRLVVYCIDAISTVTASGSFVALAFWKTAAGAQALEWMIFCVAVLAIVRSAFRFSDLADQHGRLGYLWKEVFMELDRVAFMARRAGRITDRIREEIDSVTTRFQRVECLDEMRGGDNEMAVIQGKAEMALPVDRQWMPPAA